MTCYVWEAIYTKNILLFHGIVCQFFSEWLTGGERVGKKMTMPHGGGVSKNVILWVTQFEWNVYLCNFFEVTTRTRLNHVHIKVQKIFKLCGLFEATKKGNFENYYFCFSLFTQLFGIIQLAYSQNFPKN